MKAAVYYENGGPEVLKYEDIPDPQCHPKGVVIKVEAIAIEGGDTLNRWRGPLMTNPHVVGYQAAEIVMLDVDRHVGDIRWRSAQRVAHALLLERLCRRAIDLEDSCAGEQWLTSIRVRVEAGTENHHVRGAAGNGALERLVDEPRADEHHAHRADDLDVLHRFVVAETQRLDR